MTTTLERATNRVLTEDPEGFPSNMLGEPIVLGTVNDVEHLYGIPSRRLRDLVRDGKIPTGVYVRLGRQIRFNMAALERWLRNGGNGGAP